jgi:RNA polymerase sigma-70 factor (family 1)
MMSNDFYDERALLLRLKNDDEEAYMQLYDHYHPPLYGYILRFVKVPALAEDVLQDVFLKLWEIRHRINPELSFNAYLYRISRNLVFKMMKKISGDEELRLGLMHQLSNTTEESDLKLQWKQYEIILIAAINQLPPQRQKIFRLCREQKKTYDEAAAELGISRNTVKEHMVLAVKAIKEYFKKHGDTSFLFLFFF